MKHARHAQRLPADTDPRWAALAARDTSADGAFVYGVVTTGVYCRPACPSRLAKPENIVFFDDCAAAEATGLRPCKRCDPRGVSDGARRSAAIAAACRMIEAAQADMQSPPGLEALAARAGLSPFHFHRLFKAETGVTPKAYADGLRNARLRSALGAGASVTAAIYDAGFNAPSRFYEKSREVLGMTPTAFRKGAPDAAIHFAIGQCSLGAILVARSATGICAILIGDEPEPLARDLQDRFPRAELIGGDRDFEATVAAVVGLVEAPGIGLDLPLDIRGTAFQQRVWQALIRIPAGSTATYTEVAAMIGEPRAVRAVAGACAANKIAIAIPCHRVVRNDGSLSGYRWGVARKRALLAREAETVER